MDKKLGIMKMRTTSGYGNPNKTGIYFVMTNRTKFSDYFGRYLLTYYEFRSEQAS